MPTRSTIELLPEHIGEEVNRMIRDKATIEQIVDAVAEMGETVSRSAMGRYTKNLKRLSVRINAGRDMANAIMEKMGEGPENKQADMNIHLLQAILTEIVLAAEDTAGNGLTLKPMDAMLLAKALNEMSKAKKTDMETTQRVREQAAKDAREAIKKSNVGTEDQREELIKAVDDVLGVKR